MLTICSCRIPITAATTRHARGLGVDIDPERTKQAKVLALSAGVSDLVRFRTENLFQTDLSEATVVSMYLFPELNLRLRPHLLNLTPGTRIVSHAFHMDEWTPERHDLIDGRDVFLWTVPAQIEGLWRISAPGYRDFVLRIWQQFDRVQGTAITLDEHSIPVADMKIHGPQLHFTLKTTHGVHIFSGRVEGEQMSGKSNGAGSWSATRL